jgi:hypothetical protein
MRKISILFIAVSVALVGCGSKDDTTNVDAAPKTTNANMDVKPNLDKPMPGNAGGPSTMQTQPMTAPGK